MHARRGVNIGLGSVCLTRVLGWIGFDNYMPKKVGHFGLTRLSITSDWILFFFPFMIL